MEECQQLLSKLHHARQQKLLDFVNTFEAGNNQDQEKALKKKLSLLEITVKDQQNTQVKVDTNKKQHLKNLKAEIGIKEVKKAGNNQLISTLQEELLLLLQEKKVLEEASIVEPATKVLEEEEAYSMRQLSLDLKKVTGGWLQFVFTNINRHKPDSCFFFSLRIDENRKYVVADCQPEISDMDVLMEKLNTFNNISTFVHSVRKRFTDMVR